MQRLVHRLPLLAFFVVGGAVLAQSAGSAARSFPYVGYLEENGVAVSGVRDVGVDLFVADSGGSSCDSAVFDDVVVSAGRFQLTYEDVPDACLKTGELYLALSVGPAGGTRTPLSSSSGTRARVHAVPFAMANDKVGSFLAGVNGGVLFERLGGQTRLFGESSATGVVVQPTTDIADTSAILSVKSADGTERLRVNDNDAVTINEKLTVTNSSTLQAVSATSVSASGTLSANGAVVNVTHSANSSKINFTSQGGSNNDAGLIEHVESGNTGELWVSTSDDWDGGTTNDRIVFGQRTRNLALHSFDAAGNASHLGDLSVGGAVSSNCPTGMTFALGYCIDNVMKGSTTHGNAMTTCNNEGKMICPYAAYMAIDHIQASSTQASAVVRQANGVLWTGERHMTRTDFAESWHDNIVCWASNNRAVQECNINQSFAYFCCTNAYPGVP